MSEARRREAIVRMATDPAFAERLRTDPQGAAGEFGLDDDDLAVLGALSEDEGGDGAVKLGQRLSKSSLFFGGAAHALEHPTGEHGTQSEFGLVKCDGRAGLLKCDGETSLLCNLVVPGHEHAGLQCNLVVPAPASHETAGALVCNSVAGVLKCNGIVLHPTSGDGGSVADGDQQSGVLLCNGIVLHPAGGEGGPAADGGDGGDGLRPIVVPPGGVSEIDEFGAKE